MAGLCGWTVHDDKLDEWKRRRQLWFMQGKEGKQYKANSLYQFMRRLGFFPTEVCRRPVWVRPVARGETANDRRNAWCDGGRGRNERATALILTAAGPSNGTALAVTSISKARRRSRPCPSRPPVARFCARLLGM
jgi:hypothetical protein